MKIDNLFNDIDTLVFRREHLAVGKKGYGGGYNQALSDLSGDIKEYLKGYVDEIVRGMEKIEKILER